MRLMDDLLKDSVIIHKYKVIQQIDGSPYYHGMQHIHHVLSVLKKMVDLFEIQEHEADKLATAVIFHDIGRGVTSKDHELLSAEFMREHLKTYDLNSYHFTEEDVQEIYDAIKIHDHKEGFDGYTLFQLFVNFVDKLDVAKDRINLNHPGNEYSKIYLDVISVSPYIDHNSFVLEYECSNHLTMDTLYSIPFMKGVNMLHQELAKRYHMKAEVRMIEKDES